jgi:hypothetical protein
MVEPMPPLPRLVRGVLPLLLVLGGASCAASSTEPAGEARLLGQSTAELATLEIRRDNVDLFADCPPPGEIGQGWYPPPSDWRPSPSPNPEAGAGEPRESTGAGEGSQQPAGGAGLRELVDQAYRETHFGLRHCYHENLRFDPTQDGRVAIVMRVGPTGKVEQVETWGACALAPEAIACMRDTAKRVKLRPPAGGYATVVVPGLFTEDRARRHAMNDSYTAAAYVAVEAQRPLLHRCELSAKRTEEGVYARATMTIDVDARGYASHVSVDLWRGSQPLLACAAEVLKGAVYPKPAGSRGRIIAPIAFNPKLEREQR